MKVRLKVQADSALTESLVMVESEWNTKDVKPSLVQVPRVTLEEGWCHQPTHDDTPVATLKAGLATMSSPNGGTSKFWVLAELSAKDHPAGLALALYTSLRRARVAGLKQFLVFFENQSKADPLINLLGLSRVSHLDKDGGLAFAGRIDVALSQCFAHGSHTGNEIVPSFLLGEVRMVLDQYFEDLWQTAFFVGVQERTLSQAQYVYTLENVHQFVRFTTRLLGRCVAYSKDGVQRAHFIHHLDGEVNHELIIERDLEHLGVDPDFTNYAMAPSYGTRGFMATQESAIGFHEDPIMLLAAPLAAEGVTAHLGEPFLDNCMAIIASWGVTRPEKACRFLSSHIGFDGGEHGHWEGTLSFLPQYIRSEQSLARFLSFLQTATQSLLQAYQSYGTDLDLFDSRQSWTDTKHR